MQLPRALLLRVFDVILLVHLALHYQSLYALCPAAICCSAAPQQQQRSSSSAAAAVMAHLAVTTTAPAALLYHSLLDLYAFLDLRSVILSVHSGVPERSGGVFHPDCCCCCCRRYHVPTPHPQAVPVNPKPFLNELTGKTVRCVGSGCTALCSTVQ